MNTQDILITVTTDYETDEERLAELTQNLKNNVLETEVEDARLAEKGTIPAGAKALEALDWNTLIISLVSAGGVATSLLTVLNSWVSRNQGARLHMVLPNGAEITLEGSLARREDLDNFVDLIERSLEDDVNQTTGTSPIIMEENSELVPLRESMFKFLSVDEIKIICFDLGIDYEGLGGESKQEIIIALLLYCFRRNRIDALRKACLSQNPAVDWTV